MNPVYTATDVGFVIDSTKEDSSGKDSSTVLRKESIVIDGFKLPKYIPPVVIPCDSTMQFLRYA